MWEPLLKGRGTCYTCVCPKAPVPVRCRESRLDRRVWSSVLVGQSVDLEGDGVWIWRRQGVDLEGDSSVDLEEAVM